MSGVAGRCDCPLGSAHPRDCINFVCTCPTPWVESHPDRCPLYRHSVGEAQLNKH